MTFPFGYAGSPQGMGTQLTIAQYETYATIRQLNFEFWRRTKALMEFAASQGVPLGVGTGWRIQNPNAGPGFASPGNSNHEGFPADGHSGGAVAADMVPSTSWGWMQPQLAKYGLRSFQFVNNEPWHIQPVEIPASRNWRREPWVLPTWSLPGASSPPPGGVYEPLRHNYWLFPVNPNKPELRWLDGFQPTDPKRPFCAYFNDVLRVEAGQKIGDPREVFSGDQYDNPNTPQWEQGSINGQRNLNAFWNRDGSNKELANEAFFGVCGRATWALVDALATNFGRPR